MLRTLLTRRWLQGIALAAVFAVVAVLLGTWQFARHQEALAARDRVEAHYAAVPVPLHDVLSGGGFDPALEWTRVQASGRYAVDARLLVRNRPHQGRYGYEVVVPLETGGTTLLVNRGWVPNAETAAAAPQVPPAPTEPVTVTGWLRPGEGSLGRDLPAGQLASVNLAEAEAALGRPVAGAYLVLESEQVGASGVRPDRPTPLEPPDRGLGAHLAYAIQWWLTAPVGFVLVWVFARREHLEGADAAGPDRAPVRARSGRSPRIWDEEDE